MSFFFCETPLSIEISSEITGDTAHHIGTVRRIRIGEEFELQDDRGARYMVRVDTIEKRSIVVTPLRSVPLPTESPKEIHLLQALISEQNIDLILQKATELGARSVVLFPSDHSPHPLAPERIAHKTERWIQIMRNACEQSGRPRLPKLVLAESLTHALNHVSGTCIVLHEHSEHSLPDDTAYTLVVGPEGGLSEDEIALLADQKAVHFSLSPFTLRSETAAISGIAAVAALSQ